MKGAVAARKARHTSQKNWSLLDSNNTSTADNERCKLPRFIKTTHVCFSVPVLMYTHQYFTCSGETNPQHHRGAVRRLCTGPYEIFGMEVRFRGRIRKGQEAHTRTLMVKQSICCSFQQQG